jgi:hypothetical protein
VDAPGHPAVGHISYGKLLIDILPLLKSHSLGKEIGGPSCSIGRRKNSAFALFFNDDMLVSACAIGRAERVVS